MMEMSGPSTWALTATAPSTTPLLLTSGPRLDGPSRLIATSLIVMPPGRRPGGSRTIDEGDIDMARMIGVLRDNDYQGVLIPDHTPELHCKAPWHAGKAFAIGYMKALLAR